MKAHLSPSIKALLPFVPQLAPKWYELGIMLIEEIDLVMIKAKHGGDKQRCCLAMLQFWMEGYSEPTWHFLVTALKSPGVDLPAIASDIERKFIEDLTCPVCFRLYKNPKFLPCHHSYCEECLEKMQVQSKITCPECRKEATVPKGGVKDLPPNFYINRRMDRLGLKHREEDELKCSKCVENKPVVAYCMDCKSNLCQFCFENHSSHGTVSLINQRSNKSVTIEPKAMALMCKEHDHELSLFCKTCEELVCKHCVAKGHNDHDYANARMKVCKCQIELERVTSSAEEVAKNVSEVQDITDKTKEKDQEHQTKSETESKVLMLGIEQLSEASKIEELIDINDVKITTKILRYGSYYVGYEAQYCGKQYIVKKEHSQNNFSKKLMKHEWKLLAHLNHPHITKQLAMLDESKSTPVLLMEQMWMSLSEFLTNKHSHHDKISILRDAACGLLYIHEKDIVHCDLTADNILLTENLTAKLTDFGRATRGQQIFLNYLPENLDHVPPEIFEPYSKASCSTKVDMFSFGCVIIHTFIKECPVPDFDKFVETSEVRRYKKHSEVERRSICLKKFKHNCNSTKLHEIVLKCLQDNPDCRPTAATLLSLLEDQLTAIVPDTYKYVEDVCPEVSLKSERCTASINMVLVEQLRLLTALNVSGYNITDRGVDMIAAVLLETVSLTKLDLSNTKLSSVKAIKINNALKNIKSLKVLNINNNAIDDGAADSIAAVVRNNSFIEEMNLSHNKMTYAGVLDVANALSESIKVFDISSNFIASDNVADLATALSKYPVLQELNLSGNLLRLTEILTIAQSFRLHPTLQSLDLSNNAILFFSAAEFIVDIILSVNQVLINLNVCSRNIRPRRIEDYLSTPSTEINSATFTLQNLLQHSSLDFQTNFIKVVETCPVSSKDIMSYYADHFGGVFYNQYHNFAIVIPPGAILQGHCVEIQGTANYCGPYTIPDGFYPISSYFWVSADYTFKAPVYLIMSHYAKIRNLEDVSSLHVLHKCAQDPNTTLMSTITDGVYFDTAIGYCVLATDHFCSYCQAKSVKLIPERLLACYCTYDESPDDHGSLVAEVCFCPSNSECKKVVLEQCEKRNTKLQRSYPFIVADGDELYISSIDSSNVKGNEWIVTEWGKPTVTHLCDFEYWEIFRGLTVEQIREREESFEYPPRLQIRCEQIDDTKPLIFSFEVSKRSGNSREMPICIAKFSLIKKVSAPPDTTSTLQATATSPSSSASKNQNELLKETPPDTTSTLQATATLPSSSASKNQSEILKEIQTAAPLPCTGASENQNKILKQKPYMIDLKNIVTRRIMNQWEYVAEALYYDIATIKAIKQKGRENPKQCCQEFFEDWLTTNNGNRAGPKVWSTLIGALNKADEFATDIVDNIVKEVLQLKCD